MRKVIAIDVHMAEDGDAKALAPLFDAYRQFYQQPSDIQLAEQFLAERLLNEESVIFVAEMKDQACGFIQLFPSFCSISAERVWILHDLFVTPSARGMGVARYLMAKAKTFAEDSDAARIDLSTAHTNSNAQALYESLGYQLDTVYRYYSLSIV